MFYMTGKMKHVAHYMTNRCTLVYIDYTGIYYCETAEHYSPKHLQCRMKYVQLFATGSH